MCGIFGVADLGGASVPGRALAAGFAALARRGPDGHGFVHFTRGEPSPRRASPGEDLPPFGVALGHHRLAIVGVVDRAEQPMSNEDGTVWVTFNGEIYNFRALRAELERAGHRFASEGSDTEVLVHGWEEWGERLPERLTGIFAFAVLDRRGPHRLALFRDFPGVKPLHVARSRRRIAFGSVTTALAPLLDRNELDEGALDHWLAVGYGPRDRGLLAGITKLEPGTGLVVDLDTGEARHIAHGPALVFGDRPFEPAAFEQLVRGVVREQLHADVPVGFTLSGGVDSALIAHWARELHPGRRMRCFSMRFPGSPLDESPYSGAVARHLGLEQTVVDLPPVTLASLDATVAAMDEPLSDSSFYASSHLSSTIGAEVKVCVGGDGGDELFGGYDRYRVALAAARRARFLPRPAALVRRLGDLALGSGRVGRKVVTTIGAPLEVHLALETVGLLGLAPRARRLRALAEIVPARPPASALRALMAHDLGAPLSEDILFKVDRTSMQSGFEARVPFLDQRVVRYALACAPEPYVTRAETKRPLRELTRAYGLDRLLNPRKQGFAVHWQRQGPELRRAARDLPGPWRLAARGAIDPARIQGLRPLSLWAALVLELWLRRRDL